MVERGSLRRAVIAAIDQAVHVDRIQLRVDDPILVDTGTLVESALDSSVTLASAW